MAIRVYADLGDLLALHLKDLDIPPPQREHRFHPKRRWRFDLAWPDHMIAAEAEGATFARGRHTRGKGYEKDCEKYNAAALLGWTVFRFTRSQITNGMALDTIQRAFFTGIG